MQVDNINNEKPYLRLVCPYWVRKDNKGLLNLITKYKIEPPAAYEQMLNTALASNFLSTPCTEYETLTRIWALELMEQGFLIFNQGLVDSEKYLLLRHNKLDHL